MNRSQICFLMIFLIFGIITPAWSQSQEQGFLREIRYSAGGGFEFFKRTVAWDEDSEDTSKMTASLFRFIPEVEINNRFYLRGIIGYTLSDFGAIMFRELPLSVEMEVGSLGGLLVGGELEIFFIESGDFEIGGQGQYVYYSGSEKTWEMPGLNVDGEVTGKTSWSRLQAGLNITYVGLPDIYPYLFAAYDNLSGKYEVAQSIQALTGTQERKMSARGKFHAAGGCNFTLSDRFRFLGEFSVIPHSDGIDYGLTVGASYTF
jgi:hypothetical protein